jgi:hypothetical protein
MNPVPQTVDDYIRSFPPETRAMLGNLQFPYDQPIWNAPNWGRS